MYTEEQLRQHRVYNRTWRQAHPEAHRAHNKAWREKHPNYHRDYGRMLRQTAPDYAIIHRYGVEAPGVKARAGGKCDICGVPDGPQSGIDHDHRNKRIRGWLCLNCNHGIGKFADDPARLRAAAAYLERTAAG